LRPNLSSRARECVRDLAPVELSIRMSNPQNSNLAKIIELQDGFVSRASGGGYPAEDAGYKSCKRNSFASHSSTIGSPDRRGLGASSHRY
jgi:hypothetical protein